MVTMNPPVRGSLLLMLGTYLAKRGEKAMVAREHARTWVQAFVRLVLTLAGFACLIVAAFALHFVAGMVTAGISCFALSWLATSGGQSQEINPRR